MFFSSGSIVFVGRCVIYWAAICKAIWWGSQWGWCSILLGVWPCHFYVYYTIYSSTGKLFYFLTGFMLTGYAYLYCCLWVSLFCYKILLNWGSIWNLHYTQPPYFTLSRKCPCILIGYWLLSFSRKFYLASIQSPSPLQSRKQRMYVISFTTQIESLCYNNIIGEVRLLIIFRKTRHSWCGARDGECCDFGDVWWGVAYWSGEGKREGKWYQG